MQFWGDVVVCMLLFAAMHFSRSIAEGCDRSARGHIKAVINYVLSLSRNDDERKRRNNKKKQKRAETRRNDKSMMCFSFFVLNI